MIAKDSPIQIPSDMANTCKLLAEEDKNPVQKAKDTIERFNISVTPVS